MGIFVLECPHCSTMRVSCSVVWQLGDGNRKTTLMLCGSCRFPITALVLNPLGRSNDLIQSAGDLSLQGWEIHAVWPEISEPAAPKHTPPAVARRYIEGEDAFRRKSWNAAVAMYRSALDLATKALPDVPSRGSFFHRLEWLHENHRITPDMWAWADRVRIEGNDALHDPEEFCEEDTNPLRLFTEMFLKYVFELPGEVAAFREDTGEA